MTQSSETFWTRLSRRYAAQPISDPENYEATLARTLSYLHEGDEVLEIGAGTSSTALRLAPSVRRYVSSDYAAGMTEIGREKAAGAGIPGLEVVQGGLGDDALGTGPYDAVLAFNLLHLVADGPAAFGQIAGLVRPGGLFISKTPCLTGLFHLMRPAIWVMRMLGKAPRVRFFPAARLEAEITAAGFEIIESASYPAGGRSRYVVARRV